MKSGGSTGSLRLRWSKVYAFDMALVEEAVRQEDRLKAVQKDRLAANDYEKLRLAIKNLGKYVS